MCVLFQFTTENVATLLFIGRILSFLDWNERRQKLYRNVKKKENQKIVSYRSVAPRRRFSTKVSMRVGMSPT